MHEKARHCVAAWNCGHADDAMFMLLRHGPETAAWLAAEVALTLKGQARAAFIEALRCEAAFSAPTPDPTQSGDTPMPDQLA